jgi:hypothetical protein
MDEKPQVEPESQTKLQSSAENDTGPDKKETDSEAQDEMLPADNSAPENASDALQTMAVTGKDSQPAGYDAAKRSAIKVVLSAVAIAFLFGGFFIFNNKPKMRTGTKTAIETPEQRAVSRDIEKNALQNIQPATAETSRVYGAQLQEISALRDTLLGIHEDIEHLKAQYRKGIEQLEKEVSDLSQKGEISTLQQAVENPAIVFALQTIQRRQAYIKALESPSDWIFSACEELLYIKRRTMMDILVSGIAGGIDMNQHIQQINAAVQKYQPTADRLALDTTRTELEPLEAVWQGIMNQTRQYASVPTLSTNQIISEQICRGNFNRLSELTEISAETATCIYEMQGSELFLNGLSEISPGAARQLFKWKGGWICLNGIRALSPRVAHYLFRWEGNWVSLNGLTEFPAEIGEKLLRWGGKQLELMGLQYAGDFPERIAVEYLAQWERAGGKLFVTQSVRKKIDEINLENSGRTHLKNRILVRS